ncbi:MAG: hypothetical protein J6I49_00260 [Bacteroidales bacterium]|nr:hypothetical protein [Bacteroidales bacterium]
MKQHLCILLALVALCLPAEAMQDSVRLDDREPHSWSYYSDPRCPVRSLNPADVKITYYGYGASTLYSSTAAEPPGNPDVDVLPSEVGIGTDAPNHNTYIYYKTLERTDGEHAPAPGGPCRYTVIANPFSRRPTHGSGDARWRGFYKWRIKRVGGGRVYADAGLTLPLAQGATIDAEQALWLAPAAEYGMSVEFEALWARAYVFSSTNALNSASAYATGANAYERNIVLLSSSPSSLTANTRPATITAVSPDGSASHYSAFTLNHAFTCQSDTKFEYIAMQCASRTFYVCHNLLVFGRGIANPDGGHTVGSLMGHNSNPTHDVHIRVRIESGSYNNTWFTGSSRYYDHRLAFNAILGSDYDRSRNDNTLLQMQMVMGGDRTKYRGNVNRATDQYTYVVKSGTYNPGPLGQGLGGPESFYMGSSSAGNLHHQGKRSMTIEGGLFASIAGGMDEDNHDYVDSAETMVRLRIHGGTIRGSIYGAAEHATARGKRRYVITGGTVGGWIAGGSNGTQVANRGNLCGGTYIYFGGNATLQHCDDDPRISYSHGGHLFGAGSGHDQATGDDATIGRVSHSTIVIADNAYISRNVYGGGNYGYVHETGTSIHILGGTVGGRVFGGSNRQQGRRVDIVMRGGQVIGGIFGGSNILGTIRGDVNIRIVGGTVGHTGCPDTLGNVFGCGYGEQTRVEGDVRVVIGADTCRHSRTVPYIHQSVYAGGFNAPHTSTGRTFQVTTYNGHIHNSVFGGGFGRSAVITGDTRVRILGCTYIHQNVYGGGNMGRVTGDTHVRIGD